MTAEEQGDQLREARDFAALIRKVRLLPREPFEVGPSKDEDLILALDAALTEREATIESERSAFTKVYSLQVGRTTEVLAAVAAVRDLHVPKDGWPQVCAECNRVALGASLYSTYPCATALALDGLDLSQPADVPLPWGDTASTTHQEQ